MILKSKIFIIMIGLKYSAISLARPTLNLCYNYVRKRDIDKICSGYGETTMDKIKMYTKMFAHIGKEGFKGAKNDIKLFL